MENDTSGTAHIRAGWLIAIVSTACFSVAPPIARGAILAGLSPTAVLVGRMVIALALLLGFIIVLSPDRLTIDRRLGLIALLSGVINGIGFLTFFAALSRLDASIAFTYIIDILALISYA